VSPSHTVGSERKLVEMFYSDWFSSHHPTQWARNQEIPSLGGGDRENYVSIPHGGLGTCGGG